MRCSPATNPSAAAVSVGATEPEVRSARPWLTLVALSLGLMMVLLDTSIVSVANPTIGRDLGGSLGDLQWVTSAFLLAVATGLVLGGMLGDLYGRRRLFITGAVCFALTSAGCGLSDSMGMLVGFRVAQGLSAAAMMPQTLSTLRATFPPKRFQLAVGIYVAVSSAAIASGPIVGGLLVQGFGWRSIFFINVILGAVVVATARAFVPETNDPRTGRLDLSRALLLAAGLFCLVWAIVNSNNRPWGSGYTLAFLGATVVLLAGWVARAQRRRRSARRVARPPHPVVVRARGRIAADRGRHPWPDQPRPSHRPGVAVAVVCADRGRRRLLAHRRLPSRRRLRSPSPGRCRHRHPTNQPQRRRRARHRRTRVMVASVGTSLPADLAHYQVAPSLAGKLQAAKTTIAQGVIPQPHALSGHTQTAVVEASHQAMTGGLHLTLTIVAAVACVAGLAALGLINTKESHA